MSATMQVTGVEDKKQALGGDTVCRWLEARGEMLPLSAALLRVRSNVSFATPGHRGGRGFRCGGDE